MNAIVKPEPYANKLKSTRIAGKMVNEYWEMVWRARKPMGLTPLPPAVLAVPPGDRLAWMVGRNEIEGVEPAGLF